jgi:hypothetical protein
MNQEERLVGFENESQNLLKIASRLNPAFHHHSATDA